MLPKPNGKPQYSERYFSFPVSELSVSLGVFSRNSLTAFSDRTGIQIKEEEKGCLTLLRDRTLAREEYRLTITEEGIYITASAEQGVILALTTVWQLLDDNRHIPCMVLRDYPRCAHRGLLLDCVRHFFSIEEVKRVIEQMARVKLNILHWVLTNDQGWRIESKRFPKLNESGDAFYSQDEIRDLVTFASLRGIEVIPEIDMPGHMTAFLSSYPMYSCFEKPVKPAVTGGIYPVILCAGKEQTYEMIDSLLAEICPLFPGQHIHLGGDEAPKREWKECPCCQQKMEAEGLANESQLQGYFMNRCFSMARKYGKDPICWNESLSGGNLDKSVLVQYWTVDQAESAGYFVKHGGKLIYSDMFSLYLDYPHFCIPLSRIYNDGQVIDEMDVSLNLYGMEACLWTERIDTSVKLEAHLFPRLYAFAEAAWTQEKDEENFLLRMKDFMLHHHPEDLNFTPETEWEADSSERIRKVLAYMNSVTAAMSEEVKAATLEASAPGPAFQKRFAKCFLGRSV